MDNENIEHRFCKYFSQ